MCVLGDQPDCWPGNACPAQVYMTRKSKGVGIEKRNKKASFPSIFFSSFFLSPSLLCRTHVYGWNTESIRRINPPASQFRRRTETGAMYYVASPKRSLGKRREKEKSFDKM